MPLPRAAHAQDGKLKHFKLLHRLGVLGGMKSADAARIYERSSRRSLDALCTVEEARRRDPGAGKQWICSPYRKSSDRVWCSLHPRRNGKWLLTRAVEDDNVSTAMTWLQSPHYPGGSSKSRASDVYEANHNHPCGRT